MNQVSGETNGDRLVLPVYLSNCVRQGLIDQDTAQAIERFRRRSGLGLSKAIERFGGVLATEPKQAQGKEGYQPLLLSVPLDPRLTFDSFVLSPNNDFPVEVAGIIAGGQERAKAYTPLYIYGGIGVGKTHLLSAMAAASKRPALLVNTADLEVEFLRARKLDAWAELRRWLISWDLLLVDDVQLCERSEALQHELFAVFNHLLRAEKAVVISSDLPPTRLEGIESRLLSRLGSGVILGLQMGDREARLRILEQVLADSPLPEDVVAYLAANVEDSVRRLKAAARQLAMMADGGRTEITLDLARAVVPLESDIAPAASAGTGAADQAVQVERFKRMLESADNEDEQALALQIALGQRLRQLRRECGPAESIERLEQALGLLREGKLRQAMACLES